ncbi:MAG: TIGR02099 family protein [Burkholderiales bacterium]|nr:TIGR02099 family protein [Burkholderiales bacterium]
MSTDTEKTEQLLAPRERRWYRAARLAGWTLIACYFLAAIGMLGLRFLVLPRVADYRAEIARFVSESIGARVEIGAIEAEWSALHPRLTLADVRVLDPQGDAALVLPYVGATVAWRSLAYLAPHLRSLVLDRPVLQMRRDAGGRLFVAGLALASGAPRGGGTLADWILDQDEIVVRDASLEWTDALRGAPPLRLDHVSFVLEERGGGRRFALRAQPPRALAATLDVRGDLRGARSRSWRGGLYVASDYVDLAAWQAWIDYPIEVAGGRGAVKAWLGFDGMRLTELTVDLALADVAARLAPDLPALELESVQGRIGVREVRRAADLLDLVGRHDVRYDGFARRVALKTRSGEALPATDFALSWDPDEGGGPPRGEFRADALELEVLAHVAEHVPLPARARRALAGIAPRGRLDDVRVSWTGDVEQPQAFRARSRFAGLGMQPWAGVPGFAGLGGSVDADEAGGTVALDATGVRVQAPQLFAGQTLEFDSLAARVGWSRGAGGFELRIENAVVANADLGAKVSGVYRTLADSPGYADFTGELARVAGPAVHRYIPAIGPATRGFLKRAIRAGIAPSARVRVRGDLREFPFGSGSNGEFSIVGKASGATLAYAEGWPAVTGIQGEIEIAGPGIEIRAERGSVLGAEIGRTVAAIPDMFRDERLHVDGTASGPTDAFLRFIETSPVNEMIGRFTEGWRAQGAGRLALKFELPLDGDADARIAGSYELADNRLVLGPGEPALERTTGRVSFTERTVSAEAVRTQLFGGPLTLGFATREGGTVVLSGEGRFDAAALAREQGWALGERVKGGASYRLGMTYRGRFADVVVESDLQGVALDLPAPLAKRADERWPSRLERTTGKPAAEGGRSVRRDTVSFALGEAASGIAEVRYDGTTPALERVAVGLGGVGVALPRDPGIVLAANVPALDLDRFRALLPRDAAQGLPARDGGGGVPGGLPAAISLRADTLVVLGRRFNGVSVRAQAQADGWQAQVRSREVTGDLVWRSEGRGSLVARLARLEVPKATVAGERGRLSELPALDIVADRLVDDDHELGKLALLAVNDGQDWRIERLLLSAPEGSISGEGRWRPLGDAAELTDMHFKLQAADAGAYLARFGYPGAVQGGTALLEGRISWSGPPHDLDYATLAGELTLRAEKGQFLKVEPGLGKLLGVLSLQSLPRRVTLDFRDVFSAGFAFDTITASARVARGVMSTDDFVMIGPSAAVTMKGRTDIAAETQDLQVRVVPDVGSGVAAAAGIALLNPLVGAGTLLAQALLKNPIGQMFAFEYAVTGTWSDPKVAKVAAAEPAAGTAPN